MHEVDGLNDELVINLARNLPELKCLHLTDVIVVHNGNDTFTVNVNGLMQMLKDDIKLNVDDAHLKENENILNIK